MPSEKPTPWAVTCGEAPMCSEGLIFLTREEYDQQVNNPNATWKCPKCGGEAWWDDDNYEKHLDSIEGGSHE